jgi:EPS-associated MarR family transcriptional regulator
MAARKPVPNQVPRLLSFFLFFSPPMEDALRYQLLKILADSPAISQRQLAKKLGLSLGKTNYCLHALIDKGLIKAERFRQSSHKSGYVYVLTPQGIEAKARVTYRFLKKKMQEYESLKQEIAQLQQEVDRNNGDSDS